MDVFTFFSDALINPSASDAVANDYASSTDVTAVLLSSSSSSPSSCDTSIRGGQPSALSGVLFEDSDIPIDFERASGYTTRGWCVIA
ncbi:hypothetical protein ONZ45_g7352 [Pleurotus djamor]|nr:hypothetical protein ONZ45_g7352 [Pleurotus djamor]